jgi:hypothetical protein
MNVMHRSLDVKRGTTAGQYTKPQTNIRQSLDEVKVTNKKASIFSPKNANPVKSDLPEKETAYSDCLSSMIQRLPFYNKRVEASKTDSIFEKLGGRVIRTP